MYAPLNYEQINLAAGSYSPSSVKAYNNKTFDFWSRALFQRACSVIDFDLDKRWQGTVKDFFLYCLFRYGYVAVFDNEKFGFSFQPCTLYGYDFYYRPTNALIANPLYNADLTIGTDCEILKLTPDYMGIWDIIEYYAEKLSELDVAINMSIINNKLPYILAGRNKAASEALKKVLDLVNSGEPAVILDKQLLDDKTDKQSPFQFFDREHLKTGYITTDQLKDFQTILNNFDCEIGIPTIPYEKKERMVTSEAESRKADSNARLTIWLETLNSSFEVINEKYGTSMKASMHYDQEVGEGEMIDE